MSTTTTSRFHIVKIDTGPQKFGRWVCIDREEQPGSDFGTSSLSTGPSTAGASTGTNSSRASSHGAPAAPPSSFDDQHYHAQFADESSLSSAGGVTSPGLLTNEISDDCLPAPPVAVSKQPPVAVRAVPVTRLGSAISRGSTPSPGQPQQVLATMGGPASAFLPVDPTIVTNLAQQRLVSGTSVNDISSSQNVDPRSSTAVNVGVVPITTSIVNDPSQRTPTSVGLSVTSSSPVGVTGAPIIDAVAAAVANHLSSGVNATEPSQNDATLLATAAVAAAAAAAAATTVVSAQQQDTTTDGTLAIDNKIEQAMDLVKTHLRYAVREEVEVLKQRIQELEKYVELMEKENRLLREYAPPEILAQIRMLDQQLISTGYSSQQQQLQNQQHQQQHQQHVIPAHASSMPGVQPQPQMMAGPSAGNSVQAIAMPPVASRQVNATTNLVQHQQEAESLLNNSAQSLSSQIQPATCINDQVPVMPLLQSPVLSTATSQFISHQNTNPVSILNTSDVTVSPENDLVASASQNFTVKTISHQIQDTGRQQVTVENSPLGASAIGQPFDDHNSIGSTNNGQIDYVNHITDHKQQQPRPPLQ